MDKKPLIILTGPTAVGKTAMSVKLAKAIGGEIISADSMQVYKHMDIGTAKVTNEEMDNVTHYLIDILEPDSDFNVAVFKEMALEALDKIYSKGAIPIIAGGTGFYIQALLYDIDFDKGDDGDTRYRSELRKIAEEKGNEYLHDMLRKVDPDAATAIHANNVKRVIRALEFFKQTGEMISRHNEKESKKVSAFNSLYFVLNDDRDRVYERIDKRVDNMFDAGLEDEVKKLLDMGCKKDSTAMQGIGYKEVIGYLDGEYDLETAIDIIKRDTRHFAKRQITWFKREKDVIWLDYPKFNYDTELILQEIIRLAKEKGIVC
ncbi:MAG: tRNA (adenosine(37)-N6)-dimethylallyltransferase MiaA [Lachnospiraceae bacterium]